jgi:hypothetical protein
MHQMVEGQVVIDGEKDARFAIDAVGQVPLDFKVFGDRIAQRRRPARRSASRSSAALPGAHRR